MGYTTVRDGGGLDAGFKLADRAGADPGAAPRAGDPDHLADGRHRRSREPVRPRRLLRRLRSPAAEQRRQRPGRASATWCARWSAPAPTSSRRRPPAAPARAPGHGPHGRGVLARGDAGAGDRVARPRPPRDVPRARRPRAAHRARRRRRLDRARLLPRRGAGACWRRWPSAACSSCPRSPSTSITARARRPTCARARGTSISTTWRPCSARSSWACRSRRAPTRAATAIRRTRSRSCTWWRRASRRCRRCARPPSGRPSASALERELGTVEKGRLADLVVVDGNPLDDVKVLLEPARIQLVVKGGAICVDRRPK